MESLPIHWHTNKAHRLKCRWLDGSPYAKAWRFTLDSEDPKRVLDSGGCSWIWWRETMNVGLVQFLLNTKYEYISGYSYLVRVIPVIVWWNCRNSMMKLSGSTSYLWNKTGVACYLLANIIWTPARGSSCQHPGKPQLLVVWVRGYTIPVNQPVLMELWRKGHYIALILA